MLRPGEWEQLASSFPDPSITDGGEGSSLVELPKVLLPVGWSMVAVPVWFLLPVGYPAAQPDCFWTDANLRLASGQTPANSGPQALPLIGAQALWFSWHLTAWRPSHDSVTTYARFCLRRFDDPR